ncbi:thiamine diphosphokinase [Clostridium celatum]|uniref:Thiamine diphosphokinase n=1 Tax=Clostridium celatum DSM 1785 TaxID=545697 RepID=L1QF96_9CLOT|nr:thiamine diphosphokinase [Clostridium celatum]EKY26626.1 thiamine diphosphokinase [Clostridium celatum DSM 1785]MCE9653830.1 thiamine diphosphokinase [Clostridium celatum]MDU6295673.1 thiamine diphosphokinase [Clostridium celatum]MDY3360524.1 thiamine diphosphokinase [Clostridium celatum]
MKCLIVSAGSEPSLESLRKYASESDFVIGVDKGCNYLYSAGIIPEYIVGDFDSSNKEIINILEEKGSKKYKFNCEKDSTDSEIAFDLAISLGVCEIFFLGATGGRFDHSLGNIGLLLRALKKDVKANIIDDRNKISIVDKSCIISEEDEYKYISFLAYENVISKFNIKGAKYELENYDLKIGDSRTISNEFIKGMDISISFSTGKLLVIYSKD